MHHKYYKKTVFFKFKINHKISFVVRQMVKGKNEGEFTGACFVCNCVKSKIFIFSVKCTPWSTVGRFQQHPSFII